MSTENDLVAKCPQCGSIFRLTHQHLKAAKGWVQCGMCGNVFHSGIKPPLEEPAEAAQADEAAIAAQGHAEGSDLPPATSDTQIYAEEDSSGKTEAAEEAAAVGLSGLAQRMAEEVPTQFGPRLESIIIVDPNLPVADDDYGPMPEIGKAQEEETKPDRPAAESKPASPPRGGWGSKQATATSTGWIPRRQASATLSRPAKKSKLGWLWTLLALILLLGLAAQLVFHLRDRLAASSPELRPLLAQMCEPLGCVLSLPRDTRHVLILGSDLQTEAGGNLSLEVTLANRAPHAMAWPVLELTLTDVEDQPLARRMFAPSEYLPSARLENTGIQGRSEIPFILQLQSKGLKAAGYRLRMFY